MASQSSVTGELQAMRDLISEEVESIPENDI